MPKKSLFFFALFLLPLSSYAQKTDSLTNEAAKAFRAQDYKKSLGLFGAARQEARKEFGENHANYAQACNNLAYLLSMTGNDEDARALYEESFEKYEEIFGKESPEYGQACSNLATFYEKIGRFKEAESLLLESIEVVSLTLGKEDSLYALATNNLGVFYCNQAKYDKSLPLLEESMKIRKQVLGEDHQDYASSVNNLASVYELKGDFVRAEKMYQEALELTRKAVGEHHPDFARSCNNLGVLYDRIGRYLKAEPLYLKSREINEKLFTRTHMNYVISNDNLGLLYDDMGLYEKAKRIFLESRNIIIDIKGNRNEDYALNCNNLAIVYYHLGKFNLVEALYKESKKVTIELLGAEHPRYAISCNNLAFFYKEMGRYSEAEPLYKEALAITAKVYGKNHPQYALYLNNIAQLSRYKGDTTQVFQMLAEARDIRKNHFGRTSTEYAESINNLAHHYIDREDYETAKNLLNESKDIYQKIFNQEHPLYSIALKNLGYVYQLSGAYPEAERYFLESIERRNKVLGENHPDYITSCWDLASLYLLQGKLDKAEPLFLKYLHYQIGEVKTLLPSLSESQRKDYITSHSKAMNRFNEFVSAYYKLKPQIGFKLLDSQIYLKGLIFQSSQKVRKQILSDSDDKLREKYDIWKAKRSAFTRAIQLTEKERESKGLDIQKMQSEINDLESYLSQASKAFAESAASGKDSWKNLKGKMKGQEALVEIIRIPFADHSVKYMALILRSDTQEYPEIVVLENGKDLEKKYLTYYQNAISAKLIDKYSYQNYWAAIQAALGGVKKIYFSPDGVFNQINIQTLFNPNNEHYLFEDLKVQRIGSPRDLMAQDKGKDDGLKFPSQTEIHLFGFPDYEAFPNKAQASSEIGVVYTREVPSIPIDSSLRMLGRDGKLSSLPGTKEEIENIARLVKKVGLKPVVFMNREASEENIKLLDNPKVLHLATHGFFLEDLPDENRFESGFLAMGKQKFLKNPLLRSGLLLAGAEKSLKGEKNAREDGILTAEEALNLNLENTELVVLSACETGLGEIKNNEGVYGLQRAFQQAGAKTVLMSLWNVSDKATQEMMTAFYEYLLLKKLSKAAAFRKAQERIKKKYPHPYYWGAFVLIGG